MKTFEITYKFTHQRFNKELFYRVKAENESDAIGKFYAKKTEPVKLIYCEEILTSKVKSFWGVLWNWIKYGI